MLGNTVAAPFIGILEMLLETNDVLRGFSNVIERITQVSQRDFV